MITSDSLGVYVTFYNHYYVNWDTDEPKTSGWQGLHWGDYRNGDTKLELIKTEIRRFVCNDGSTWRQH